MSSGRDSVCPYCNEPFKSLLQHWEKDRRCGDAYRAAQSAARTFTLEHRHTPDPVPRRYDEQSNVDENEFIMDTMDDRELYLTDTKISGDDVHSEEPRYPPDAIPNPKGTNKSSYAIDPQTEGYIKILCFLDKIQAPIKAFDELMQLILELHHCRFQFGNFHPKRSSLLQKITSTIPIAKTKVRNVKLELPPSRKEKDEEQPEVTAPVYRFDIRHQICDLLRDDLFFDMNNLVVNRNKPFDKFVPDDGMLDEIHSGEWYSRTYDDIMQNKAKDPKNTIVLPLKLYCDKTGLDPMMQRHALEPVMFTLTIFTRDVQQNCKKAW
jgi:hypothetical protein